MNCEWRPQRDLLQRVVVSSLVGICPVAGRDVELGIQRIQQLP